MEGAMGERERWIGRVNDSNGRITDQWFSTEEDEQQQKKQDTLQLLTKEWRWQKVWQTSLLLMIILTQTNGKLKDIQTKQEEHGTKSATIRTSCK